MATSIELTEEQMTTMLREARITKPELSDRLGHWVNAAQRWGLNPPKYVVAYLKLRKQVFDIVAHIEFGTVPKDFDFIAALRVLRMKKIELGRILGVSKHTVTRWGKNPPLYVLEYVYCRYIMEEGKDDGKRAEKTPDSE